ncbi:FAD/NAD-P-binding domain-containing protein [Roridomyces roridus]|uniref:FAD/NAD-P-binding domain-containing protein n=1 Tax=Roridomyces roridus TaxID=1738132 RepID=A0AAD7FPY6_9AGAR|nr:FAD/NAD-P-binding domain-containing protein [Roridomyces roridus]
MPVDHVNVASAWLQRFAASLVALDLPQTVSCFHSDGFLRDILVFTWSNRTLAGHANITSYLDTHLSAAAITGVELDMRAYLSPESSEGAKTVTSGFIFETAVGPGQGYFSLIADSMGEWRAMSVFMMLRDIRGHEEAGPEEGIYGGHTLAWEDVARERRERIERDPYVLIVGGGQTGLNVAARFKQMDIPTLIVEKNAQIGDNWRQRYPTLTLHTVRKFTEMLYQQYPSNWPIFAAKDRVGQWLQQYAESADLVVWTSSYPLPKPSYDNVSKRWTVVISREGKPVTIHPAHIVIAAGVLGAPDYPTVHNPELFTGRTLHAANYPGGAPYSGQRVIVVGAGNSAADICQDLVVHCAQSVTMVQRSSTCVISAQTVRRGTERTRPEGVPIEVSDFKGEATPYLLRKRMLALQEEAAWEAERETHRGLREAGMKLTMGPDGGGFYVLSRERFGGFCQPFGSINLFQLKSTGLDVGCAKLVRESKVLIKQGVEPASFTQDSLVFTDGSSLPADVVIYATSYENIRDNMRPLFGDQVIDQTSPVWGVDDEGELLGCYRASGYPGLWFAAGNFSFSRFFSKQLAMEIKAIQLGLYEI